MENKENVEAAYLAGRLAAEKREKSWWVGASYGMLAVATGLLVLAAKAIKE